MKQTWRDKNSSPTGLIECDAVHSLFNFTAFYADHGHLLFVLDKTCDQITPNVRLILNKDPKNPDRKWDEILSKDYGLDLQQIRPKKGHLFQKLDIEYDNLSVYERAFDNPKDDILLNRIVINKEKAAFAHALKRMEEERYGLEKAEETVEGSMNALKAVRKSLALAQARMQKLKALKKEHPHKVDEEKESRALELLYKAIEKEKIRERRVKRAKVRIEKSRRELDAIHARLQLIQERLDKHSEQELKFFQIERQKQDLVKEYAKPDAGLKDVLYQKPSEVPHSSKVQLKPTNLSQNPIHYRITSHPSVDLYYYLHWLLIVLLFGVIILAILS